MKIVRKNSGFTLIELLVAIGIMAVLTAMAAFNFNQSRIRARDVQRKNDLKQLQNALEIYRNDNNSYPLKANYQTTLSAAPSYIKTVFRDPRISDWVDYQYLPSADQKTYYLQACLENVADAGKVTDETLCGKFTLAVNNKCECGPGSSIGVMFIITQP